MQLGTFMGHINCAAKESGMSQTEVFELFKKEGLCSVDVFSGDVRGLSPKGMYERLEGNGISVGSFFHLFAFDGMYAKEIETLKEDIKRQIEACVDLHTQFYMPVPVVNNPHKDEQAFLDTRKRFAEYLQNALEIGNQVGVQTVVENYSDRKNPNASIEDIAYLLKEVPDLKYVLDCGNFWFGGEDVLTAVDLFLDKTVHVHLKDLIETPTGKLDICGKRGESVAIGEGEIPTERIIQKLKASGYTGGLTVEINRDENMTEKIALSLGNIKTMLEE